MSMARSVRVLRFLRAAPSCGFSTLSRAPVTGSVATSTSVSKKAVLSTKAPSRSLFGLFGKKETAAPVTTLRADELNLPKSDPFYPESLSAEERKQFLSADNFNLWMKGFLAAGSYTAVADAFMIMLLKGVEPNSDSWSYVVQAYKEDGKTEDLELFATQVASIMEMSQPQRDELFTKIMKGPTESDIAEAREKGNTEANLVMAALNRGEVHEDHDEHEFSHKH